MSVIKKVFQFKMSATMVAILVKVSLAENHMFDHSFPTNCDIDTNIKRKIYSLIAIW